MILITGANGLVGSYLCRYLLHRGKSIRALRRTGSDMRLVEDIKDQIEWVEGDILDVVSLENAMQGVDHVFHCAAMISYVAKNRDQLMQVNVEGTSNVVNVALDSGIKKLVYISSIAALGRTGKDGETVNEETPWERKNLTSDYSVSKFLAEREVWRANAEGLKVVIVNPAIIVGAGNWNAGSCKLFTTVHSGFKFYTGGVTGYVDVRDVAKIAATLMESETEGQRFVLCSENISYKDFLTSIARAMQVKGPTVLAGKFLSGMAWRMEWMKSMFTGKEPTVTRQTATIANKKVYFDNTKIRALGYNFIPLQQSISETAEAFNSELQSGKFQPLKF